MAEIASLWREARGIHQDDGRDHVPARKVWDLIDFIPRILGSSIRGRGAWVNKSDAQAAAADGLIFAPFASGPQLLAVLSNGAMRNINLGSVTSFSVGTVNATLQNPVFHRDRVIVPNAGGGVAASFVSSGGTITAAPASALTGKLATVFKDRLILAASSSLPTTIAFSKPGDPTLAWDSLSRIPTSLPLTGIAAQRNQLLAFHSGSVERLRGTTPPDSAATDPTGDMILDTLFDKAGCFDPRSIALWQDNVIFADSRGVHITDGAVVRNMCTQGGIESLWRYVFAEDPARGAVLTVTAGILRDLYIVTVRNTSGPPITFACDIPTREWWRLSNIDGRCYASSLGESERLFAGDSASLKIIELTQMLKPDPTITQVDGDGTTVLPILETGWNRLGDGEEAIKRAKNLYVSYETGILATDTTAAVDVSLIHGPSAANHYHVLASLPHSNEYRRRRLRVGRASYGFGVKFAAVAPTKDLRLHDIGTDAYAEEEQKVGML